MAADPSHDCDGGSLALSPDPARSDTLLIVAAETFTCTYCLDDPVRRRNGHSCINLRDRSPSYCEIALTSRRRGWGGEVVDTCQETCGLPCNATAAPITTAPTTSAAPDTGLDTCQYANDGACDEPTYCRTGSDCTDCGYRCRPKGLDTCEFANDGTCDEPTYCDVGTDCADCGYVCTASPTTNPTTNPTTASPTMLCHDNTVYIQTWTDSRRNKYNCSKYAQYQSWCTLYGDRYATQSLTANQACCGCGGGYTTSQITPCSFSSNTSCKSLLPDTQCQTLCEIYKSTGEA